MTPFDCYKQYIALKNHFTKDSYDYHKYQGKTNVKVDTFEKRKDKLFFQKLAKHPDVVNFLVANLSQNSKAWIKELAYSEQAEKNYKEWLKKQQSLSYVIKQELSKLDDNFNDNFICRDNHHPILMRLYLAGDVSLETFCVLLNMSGALKHWDKSMEYDLIWQELRVKYIKYLPFINYNKENIKKSILDFYSN